MHADRRAVSSFGSFLFGNKTCRSFTFLRTAASYAIRWVAASKVGGFECEIMNIEFGQGVDFDGVRNDYESGLDYIDKYRAMRVHLIHFTFDQLPSNWLLFNHEAIYKPIKGYFHEVKRLCFTKDEYTGAGPLFLYEVERGSGMVV